MFTKLSDFEQASFYYQQAIKLTNEQKHPDESAQLYFNLASIERYQGKLSLAEQHLNHALLLNPNDYEAYLLRASLKKQTTEHNHIKQLEQVIAQGIKHPIAQAQVHYALAKEQEDLALFPQSFNQLNLGAKARRAHIQYNVEHDLSTIKQIRATFNQAFFEQQKKLSSGYNNNEAIFILGLPRTGSTLIERIVSNHHDVFSAGELNNFALRMMDEAKKIASAPPKSRSELVELTSNINFTALGESYIKSTRPETNHTAHFIDKLPLNSLYVGLIHLALPKAKIIQVTRHPLDTCYAIYKQLFTNGYPFSYDLTELARYYIEHHKMMVHWHNVMPNVIHQVAYEDVVNNLTAEAQKLIAYCQLDWQPQCSDFQKNTAPSTTASASQVRQKIYQSSKGKWRQFEQELSPIKHLLEQAGICCD
jgi:tetratricopeptide (TPR) repeat protein